MHDKILVENAVNLGWIEPKNTIRWRKTTDLMAYLADQYRKAKDIIVSAEKVFNNNIDKDEADNPIGCVFRETYIHAPDNHYADVEVRIHACRRDQKPNVKFKDCPICEFNSCPLLDMDSKTDSFSVVDEVIADHIHDGRKKKLFKKIKYLRAEKDRQIDL